MGDREERYAACFLFVLEQSEERRHMGAKGGKGKAVKINMEHGAPTAWNWPAPPLRPCPAARAPF